MKVIFIDTRRCMSYFLLAALVVSILVIVSLTGIRSISAGAFYTERDLPIYSVDREDRTAAITFDCAWGADDIPVILDTLEKEKVKATFFLVGQWAEKFPDTVRAIASKGHDVANHSYSHLRMGALDRNKIASEIAKCGQSLESICGTKAVLFRAPYGDYSNNVVSTARGLGYYTIQWNVDSLDWKPGISAETIKSRVMERIKPGSIILFHNDTPHTSKILTELIRSLKSKGYSLLPVSEIIIRENYVVDPEGRQKVKD